MARERVLEPPMAGWGGTSPHQTSHRDITHRLRYFRTIGHPCPVTQGVSQVESLAFKDPQTHGNLEGGGSLPNTAPLQATNRPRIPQTSIEVVSTRSNKVHLYRTSQRRSRGHQRKEDESLCLSHNCHTTQRGDGLIE